MSSLTIEYSPRDYQQAFEAAMFDGTRRAYLLYHRRAGKDYACWHFMVNWALAYQPATYFYVLPTYAQGKRIIWDGIDESGRRFIDIVPPELLDGKPNSTEMKLRLANGSIIQVVGSDNYDSLRGTNPYGIVFSEYALQNPRVWEEVASPILAKNGGWAVFNSTPYGKNHAYELWNMAKKSDDWYTRKLTIDNTGLIGQDVIARERAEGKSEEVIQQEYYCSFDRSVEGAYYAKELATAKNSGRIGKVAYDPNYLVYTAWDLGYTDAMSIVFFQVRGDQILVINHYENKGYALVHYLEYLRALPYQYGTHYIPHDGANRSAITGDNYVSMAAKLGVKLTVLNCNQVLIDTGINKVRGLFHRMFFDEEKCGYLIKALENYHARYDEKLNILSMAPLHNWASHSADSIRTLAHAMDSINNASNDYTREELEELRARHRWG